jgi:hypothetical protein
VFAGPSIRPIGNYVSRSGTPEYAGTHLDWYPGLRWAEMERFLRQLRFIRHVSANENVDNNTRPTIGELLFGTTYHVTCQTFLEPLVISIQGN